jgi:type II secretory pathway predicted ATPase ExeA
LEGEMSDSEDDSPQLSREALTALQEFYTQQAEKDKKLRCILEGKERLLQRIQFDEDWVRVIVQYFVII